jgi:hypothetical protein
LHLFYTCLAHNYAQYLSVKGGPCPPF